MQFNQVNNNSGDVVNTTDALPDFVPDPNKPGLRMWLPEDKKIDPKWFKETSDLSVHGRTSVAEFWVCKDNFWWTAILFIAHDQWRILVDGYPGEWSLTGFDSLVLKRVLRFDGV